MQPVDPKMCYASGMRFLVLFPSCTSANSILCSRFFNACLLGVPLTPTLQAQVMWNAMLPEDRSVFQDVAAQVRVTVRALPAGQGPGFGVEYFRRKPGTSHFDRIRGQAGCMHAGKPEFKTMIALFLLVLEPHSCSSEATALHSMFKQGVAKVGCSG